MTRARETKDVTVPSPSETAAETAAETPPKRRGRPPGTGGKPKQKSTSIRGSDEARHKAYLIIEALSGLRSPSDASALIGVTINRYYQLESRGLQGFVDALETRPAGRQPSPEAEDAEDGQDQVALVGGAALRGAAQGDGGETVEGVGVALGPAADQAVRAAQRDAEGAEREAALVESGAGLDDLAAREALAMTSRPLAREPAPTGSRAGLLHERGRAQCGRADGVQELRDGRRVCNERRSR